MKRLLLFFALLFSAYISFQVFISMRVQLDIDTQMSAKTFQVPYDEIESLFPYFPNISVTTIPLSAYKAYLYFTYSDVNKALSTLDNSENVNPYIFFNESLKSQIFTKINNLDSALYYAKKAFYGWPKNIDHYTRYSELLVTAKDTLEILNAFDHIDSLFYDRSQYGETFITSLAKAKLSYIANYDSTTTISKEFLYGKWKSVIEFENGSFITKSNNVLEFDTSRYTDKDLLYGYQFKRDTIFLNPILNPSFIITKIGVRYSSKFNTLLLYPSQRNGYAPVVMLKRLD
jgi:hypothetical protein